MVVVVISPFYGHVVLNYLFCVRNCHSILNLILSSCVNLICWTNMVWTNLFGISWGPIYLYVDILCSGSCAIILFLLYATYAWCIYFASWYICTPNIVVYIFFFKLGHFATNMPNNHDCKTYVHDTNGEDSCAKVFHRGIIIFVRCHLTAK